MVVIAVVIVNANQVVLVAFDVLSLVSIFRDVLDMIGYIVALGLTIFHFVLFHESFSSTADFVLSSTLEQYQIVYVSIWSSWNILHMWPVIVFETS